MPQAGESWMDRWIDSVADGSVSMSQRRLCSVERNGGVAAAISSAVARGVHLAKLTDDEGHVLIAASVHPFERLC